MRVFITGGAGFIGSTLCDRLIANGDSVCILDNFETGRRENIETIPVLKYEGSVSDRAMVDCVFQEFKPDVVVHAAASYKNRDNWHGDALTNTVGTSILAKASKLHNVKRLIYFQTALCYGLNPGQHPIKLDHPIDPGSSSYAISKTAGEQYIALSGVDHVIFRLANAYGPRNLSGPLPTFYKRITEGQICTIVNTRRDFIYIDDLIDCVMKALNGKGHGAYHIATGHDYAIGDLFEEVVRSIRPNHPPRVERRVRALDDAYSIMLDPERTHREFDWRPKVNLREGVAKAVEWYRSHPIDQTFTHLGDNHAPSVNSIVHPLSA